MKTLSLNKKIVILISSLAGIVFLPYIGAYFRFEGNFPDEYFAFPALSAPPKAEFSLPMFILISLTFLAIFLLYSFPRLFGFKAKTVSETQKTPPVHLPIWFWLGFLMWGITLTVLWGKFSEPRILINWAVLPLFWGFTLMIDGWVYVRNNSISLVSKHLQELLGIGLASISGWLIFEYLNFFVQDNWIYPKGDIIPNTEFFFYAVLGSSGLVPMSFEWYFLFRTFKKFSNRYSDGIKLIFPKWLQISILIICATGLLFTSFYPDDLFFLIWLAPLLIISIILDWIGVWTPFMPVTKGNWTPLMLISLSYLLQGFLCEFWNYFSGTHIDGKLSETYNPDYWTYSIPYVDLLHVFEMPLLGFLGYLPFGAYGAVWWMAFTFLFNIPSNFLEIENPE
jgi:hypothetical protein